MMDVSVKSTDGSVTVIICQGSAIGPECGSLCFGNGGYVRQSAGYVRAVASERISYASRHGQFLRWIEAEFNMSDQSAHRFMHVARRLSDKIPHDVEFQATALYALAAPSTPDEVVAAISTESVLLRNADDFRRRNWGPGFGRTKFVCPSLVCTNFVQTATASSPVQNNEIRRFGQKPQRSAHSGFARSAVGTYREHRESRHSPL